jgi:allantoinase
VTVAVRGGTVVLADRTARLDVLIDHGRVVQLAPALDGDDVIDASGLLVFPGGVDAHVHFNEPGREDWEGFDHGSAAAAAGGVTSVVDMPIDCDPPTITADAVRAKASVVPARSRVDVGIWGGLVPSSLDALAPMVEAGVVGFKAFACPSGWDDFPPADDATLSAGCAVAAAQDLPVAVHCELAHLGDGAESEVAAVRWAATVAAAHGARLHVVHASAVEAVDEAARWPGTTIETCPHYLALSDTDAARIGGRARCRPPIRDAANRRGLLERVAAGAVTSVASDHSPCPPVLRDGPDPWAGISGVQLTLPVLLTLGIDPVVIARLTTAAARLLRLKAKGPIAVGSDADLALVDPTRPWEVTTARLYDRHRASPFTGSTLHGEVVRTLLRGRTIYDRATGPAEPGGGRVLTPS